MSTPILSVKQPWAWLIVNGHKDVENRSWRTVHRGPLLIHASGRPDPVAMRDFVAWCERQGVSAPSEPLTRGAIVGRVEVRDVIACSESPWAESEGWHWLLGDAETLTVPVACSGSLMLWRHRVAGGLAETRLARQRIVTLRESLNATPTR
jgi:hypothetical protein